ncbi:uncharacterized protein LOC127203393 [Acomys russatus]|uniref:uncharacterized protein LOC127203393 n=1 Tax=Acomys russatus TaxID=60746 RepID=UPI0021E223D2|nr:uncharacterized protein LOC127203393 [Acomys russatus]
MKAHCMAPPRIARPPTPQRLRVAASTTPEAYLVGSPGDLTDATPSRSLSWYVQKYVSWILRIGKEGTDIGCCIPNEDVPQRKRHFVHGTRIRLWPPSRVEPTYPKDVSNRVIMEVVPCVFSEEEEDEEEDESIRNVEPSDKENSILETPRDPFHPHRRSEESIKCPSWNTHRQWDWSSDEEDVAGHVISAIALVHAEACFSHAKDGKTEAVGSCGDICVEVER